MKKTKKKKKPTTAREPRSREPVDESKPLFRRSEVARLLGVHTDTVKQLVAEEKLDEIVIGSRPRYRGDDVRRLLREGSS